MLLSYKEIHSRKGFWCSVKKEKKMHPDLICHSVICLFIQITFVYIIQKLFA